MFNKYYLSRRQTRLMSSEYPVGDPTGGAAYREMRDPVTAGIVGATTLASGLIGANASKSAASTQSNAALQAAAMQQQTASNQISNMQAMRDQQIKELQAAQQSGIVNSQQGNADAQAQLEALRTQQLNTLSQNYSNNQAQQGNIYNTSMGNLQPYLQTGQQGATTLASMIPQLTQSFTAADLQSNLAPNYEFMKQQGLGATSQAMNVGGGGSNIARANTKFAEDYASNAYQNAFNNWQNQQNNIYNRLAGISGIGTAATGQGITAGGQYGSNLANLGINYGSQTNAANLGFGTAEAQTGLGYNQLAAQQGLGFGQTMANFNANTGQNIATLATGGAGAGAAGLTGSAAANAAGQIGSTNALTGAAGNAANMYLLSSLMNPAANTPAGATNTYNQMMANGGFGSGNAFGNQDLGQNF
jgi:hypothetical protein